MLNVFVFKTIPNNPLHLTNPWSLLGWACVGGGLFIRSWAAASLSKSRDLTYWGPYALSRNPLYVGSFLMMIGFCVFGRDWLTCAFIVGPLAMLYYAQIEFEEVRLSGQFPEQWPAYVASTPKVLPLKYSSNMWRAWNGEEWIRNREYRAIVATALGILAVVAWYYARINLVG